jgi:hypothetical protein
MVALAESLRIAPVDRRPIRLPIVEKLPVPLEGFLVQNQCAAERLRGYSCGDQVPEFCVDVSYVRNMATRPFSPTMILTLARIVNYPHEVVPRIDEISHFAELWIIDLVVHVLIDYRRHGFRDGHRLRSQPLLFLLLELTHRVPCGEAVEEKPAPPLRGHRDPLPCVYPSQ